jgi:hypothetical protein
MGNPTHHENEVQFTFPDNLVSDVYVTSPGVVGLRNEWFGCSFRYSPLGFRDETITSAMSGFDKTPIFAGIVEGSPDLGDGDF